MITRRRFLGWSALGAAGSLLTGCRAWQRGETGPPNVLFIMSDEHTASVAGCYGDPFARTPNLDRLAAEGVLFEDCYAPSPLCAPSRLSFLSGKHVSRVGAWSNTCWLPSDDYPTLASLLGGAGWEPLLGGKMHLDRTRRYGFTDLFSGRFNKRNKTGLVERIDPDDVKVHGRQWKRRVGSLGPTESSEVLDWDLRLTDEVVRFLGERGADAGSFLLTAGYYAPHYPLAAPAEFVRHFEGRLPPPVVPEGHVDRLPTNYRVFRRQAGLESLDPEDVRRARELYWARVSWVDHQVGRVLDALDRSPHAGNTVVIYTSDHGESKGDHGLWWKNCMFEPAVNVPLLVRWPRRWEGGQRRAGACSLLDLSCTLAELGGVEAPGDWNGDSLVPWLDDPVTRWKDRAVSEYYAREVASGFAMIREGRFKYVYHTRIDDSRGPERELYDLGADPGEFDNLADRSDQAGRVGALHETLVAELGRDPEEAEAECRAETLAGYSRV